MVDTSENEIGLLRNHRGEWISIDNAIILNENDVASLRVFMATLRKKIEKYPSSPQYIQTHIGVGYRMMKVE